MSQTCQRCYRIVGRACQSDTEMEDCPNLKRRAPYTSRYAVCAVGMGYSVENRQTGEREFYSRSRATAEREAQRLCDEARK